MLTLFLFLCYFVYAAVLNYEEDVAAYTVKAATDPRVANRVIVYRPPGNIVSQLDLISSWEKKTGCTLKKINMPEEEIVKLSESKKSSFFNIYIYRNAWDCRVDLFKYLFLIFKQYFYVLFFKKLKICYLNTSNDPWSLHNSSTPLKGQYL